MIILAKHKRLVIGLPLAVVIIAALISLVLPDVFRANTKILPPQQPQSGASALISQLGGMAGAAAGLGGIKSPNDLYIGMLKSRTVADHLIVKFNLKAIYETPSQEKARKKLEESTSISVGKDGIITIAVENEDKKLVPKLANGYVTELLNLTKVLAVTEAGQRRIFFERQLEQTKEKLADAEIKLKGAMDTHGVISVDAESRAIVETVGRLRAHISAKEAELASMQAFVTASNPSFQRVQQEINGLRAELSKLENGRTPGANLSEKNGASRSGLENIKILRDVKYQQTLFELLAKQYEIARLDEAKEGAIIQVLDPAIEPERKFKPARTIIVLLSGIAAFIVSVCVALIIEAKKNATKDPMNAKRWTELKSHLSV